MANIKIKMICQRWLDILLYLCIIGFLYHLFGFYLGILSSELPFVLDRLNFIESFLFSFIGSSLIWSFLIYFSGAPLPTIKNLKNLKYIILYPPTWSIILLIFTLIILHFTFITEILSWNTFYIIFIPACSFAIAKRCMWVYTDLLNIKQEQKVKESNSNLKQSNEQGCEQDIIEWIFSDDISKDKFQTYSLAQKISSQINGITSKNEENTSKGKNISENGCNILIGEYGSGKTTILQWVEEILLNNKLAKYNTCWIDSWGINNNELIYYLFKKGLNTLKSSFDILPLLNIPKQYEKAMSGMHNFFNLIPILNCFHSPDKILERLDSFLEFHNEKIIFIIEDLDRNNNDNTLLKIELPALLDRLSYTKNILFILSLSSNSENHFHVINKISKYINIIPKIEFKDFDNIIDDFRLKISFTEVVGREDYKTKLRDESNERLRFNYKIKVNSDKELKEKGIIMPTYIYYSAIDVLWELLSTPRVLKSVLRETYSIWQSLKGEINPDELLVLTTIKFTMPEMNKFIMNNINELQELSKSREPNNKKLRPQENIEWRFNNVKENIHKNKRHILMSFLFPEWGNNDAVPISQYKIGMDYIKSISSSNKCVNYWNRMQKGCLADEETLDQDIETDIFDIIDTDTKNHLIGEMLQNRMYFERVISLAPRILSIQYLLLFAEKLINKTVEKKIDLENTKYVLDQIDLLQSKTMHTVNIYIISGYSGWLLELLETVSNKNFIISVMILKKLHSKTISIQYDFVKYLSTTLFQNETKLESSIKMEYLEEDCNPIHDILTINKNLSGISISGKYFDKDHAIKLLSPLISKINHISNQNLTIDLITLIKPFDSKYEYYDENNRPAMSEEHFIKKCCDKDEYILLRKKLDSYKSSYQK